MRIPPFILLLLLVYPFFGYSQCSINASSDGCLDEPILFGSVPNNVKSASWDFGDNSTSTQINPVHRYTTTGSKKVKVTYTLPNNTTCTAEHDIFIHAPPEIDIEITSRTEYCLSINELCLKDNSDKGATNTPIARRLILWGDGASDVKNNPIKGQVTCYSYQRTGKYPVTIELTNTKGCKSIEEFDVTIKQDYIPSFDYVSSTVDCDGAVVCLENDSADSQPPGLTSYEWDMGDGTTYTQPWKGICHKYTKSGNYDVTFRTTLNNGCVNEKKINVSVVIPEVHFNVIGDDSMKCYPLPFNYQQIHRPGYKYKWRIMDSLKSVLDTFGTNSKATVFPPTTGYYYIQLEISVGSCTEVRIVDSIRSVGVRADANLYNANQCDFRDTVYACNKSDYYWTDSVTYFWKFGDADTTNWCTSDQYNNLNVDSNCSYVYGDDAKHKYKRLGCFRHTLIAYDHRNGCIDSTRSTVVLQNPSPEDFSYDVKKKCLGYEGDYTFNFLVDGCPGNIFINYDSACGKDMFTPLTPNYNYTTTCDPSGWVTVGFIVSVGQVKIYRSCDTTDYYYDSSRICRDTFWMHNWFKISKPPVAYFDISKEKCIPAKIQTDLLYERQPNVTKLVWFWGDGETNEYNFDQKPEVLPQDTHVYTQSGQYKIQVLLETDSGCFSTESLSLSVGYFNEIFFDSIICPHQEIQFRDSVLYWDDPRQFWRDTSRAAAGLEMLKWNLDDGRGWFEDKPLPKVNYPKEGTYLIQLATKDKFDCRDTARRFLHVVGVNAHIKNIDKELLCDDIIQFFDSSWIPSPFDSVTKWYWDFGDGRTPSYLQDPFHFYSSYGEFVLTLAVETDSGCKDTTTLKINIDGPKPYFDIVSDSVGCVPFTAEFRNLSADCSDFIWYFGDSSNTTLSTQSDTNIKFTYDKPGVYYIYLWGADSVTNPDNNNNIYYCKTTFPDSNAINPIIRRVVVLPIPKADFLMDTVVCTSSPMQLTDISDSIYKIYRWYISNGDSIISTTGTGDYRFADTGEFSISYLPYYIPKGPYQRSCYDTVTRNVKVRDYEGKMSFEQVEDCPIYKFTNESKNVRDATWDFGDNVSGDRYSKEYNTEFNFVEDPGDHEICLYVTNKYGCMDTVCTTINSTYNFQLFIPNIITPQNDGLNDEYEIDIENEDLYDLKIYNRWGELVYRRVGDAAYGSGLNWDGTEFRTGKECPAGTYYYIFKYRKACYKDEEVVEGTVTLLR